MPFHNELLWPPGAQDIALLILGENNEKKLTQTVKEVNNCAQAAEKKTQIFNKKFSVSKHRRGGG